MSLEVLKSIQHAEAGAEDIRSQAQHEAREMQKGVEAACAARERGAAIEYRTLYQALMDDKQAQVQKAIDANEKEHAKERESLSKKAEAYLDRAATLVFERVVNDGHC